jgi:hypothetical protein
MPQKWDYAIISISQKLFSFGIFLQFPKTYLFAIIIHELSLVLMAIGTIIANEYFVWKLKYYFIYILLPLQYIAECSMLLLSVVKHLTCSLSIT